MLSRILFSVKPQHASAIGIHILPPSWTPFPFPTPSHPSRLIQSPYLSFLRYTADSHQTPSFVLCSHLKTPPLSQKCCYLFGEFWFLTNSSDFWFLKESGTCRVSYDVEDRRLIWKYLAEQWDLLFSSAWFLVCWQLILNPFQAEIWSINGREDFLILTVGICQWDVLVSALLHRHEASYLTGLTHVHSISS